MFGFAKQLMFRQVMFDVVQQKLKQLCLILKRCALDDGIVIVDNIRCVLDALTC